MTLGERLVKLRKEKGLSQEEVAEKLNVSRQSVSKWELDQSLPDFDKIIPLCELYEIETDELLKGSSDKKTEEEIYNERSLLKGNYVRKERAKAVCISLIIFVLAIVWVIVADSLSFVSDEITASGFLIIGMLGVVNLVYRFASLPNIEKDEKKVIEKRRSEKKDPKYKHIKSITSLLFLMIYLMYSFATGRWYISWIIWIIYALVMQVIQLIMNVDDDDDDEGCGKCE